MAIAYATTGAGTTGGSWMTWVMILVIFAALYFFTIRPQSKRDKELRNLRNSLKPGDEIVTIGGIYGKIVRIKDDRITLQVGSDRTRIEVAKWAINNVEKQSETKGSKPAEEEKKVTPKNMKKLGEKTEAAAEPAQETAAQPEDAQ